MFEVGLRYEIIRCDIQKWRDILPGLEVEVIIGGVVEGVGSSPCNIARMHYQGSRYLIRGIVAVAELESRALLGPIEIDLALEGRYFLTP